MPLPRRRGRFPAASSGSVSARGNRYNLDDTHKFRNHDGVLTMAHLILLLLGAALLFAGLLVIPYLQEALLLPLIDGMARLSQKRGWLGKALSLRQKALALREKKYGKSHYRLAKTLTELGDIYSAKHQHQRAAALYQRALAMLEKKFGETHPETLDLLNRMAGTYCALGRYSEARPLYERAVRILETQFGRHHPKLALGLDHLAGVHQAQGQFAEALPLYKRALEITQAALGYGHEQSQALAEHYALCLQTMASATSPLQRSR